MGSFPAPMSPKAPTCKSVSLLQLNIVSYNLQYNHKCARSLNLQIQRALAKLHLAKEMQKKRLRSKRDLRLISKKKKKKTPHNPSFHFLIQFKSWMKQRGLINNRWWFSQFFCCIHSVCMQALTKPKKHVVEWSCCFLNHMLENVRVFSLINLYKGHRMKFYSVHQKCKCTS